MDFDKLLDLHNKGYSQLEIAQITGYKQSNISVALRAAKCGGRRAKFSKIENPIVREFCIFNNLTIKGVAQIMKCSVDKASAFLTGDREVRFSVEQINRLLSAMNKTYEEVFCYGM